MQDLSIRFLKAFKKKNALKCISVMRELDESSDVPSWDALMAFISELRSGLRQGIYGQSGDYGTAVKSLGLPAVIDLLGYLPGNLEPYEAEVHLLRAISHRCSLQLSSVTGAEESKSSPSDQVKDYHEELQLEQEQAALERGAASIKDDGEVSDVMSFFTNVKKSQVS